MRQKLMDFESSIKIKTDFDGRFTTLNVKIIAHCKD